MKTKWIPQLGLAALLLSAVLASAANAGQYHVYSCRTPTGAAAPADGWSGAKSGTYTYIKNTCSEPGGALVAALGDQPVRTANTDSAKWELAIPATSSLIAATLWRAGDADGGGGVNASYGIWLAAPLDQNDPADAFSQCTAGILCPAGLGNSLQPFAAENRVVLPAGKLAPHLFANAACFGQGGFECPVGKGDANSYAAVIYVFAADLTLEQTAGPTATAVSGELATAASVAGTSDVTFNASDPGSGVYEAVFAVDGAVVQRTVIDDAGGHCRNVGQTTDGLPAFLYLQPCPASVSAALGFDTSPVANGPHHLTVSVLDAAGNSAPVLDRNVTVANPGAPGPLNGQGASTGARLEARWKSTPKELLSVGYGHPQSVTGRLLDETGKPIAGAEIEAGQTPAFAGSRTVPVKGLRTGSDGRFSLRLPPGASSRSLRFTYRARLGDAAPAETRTLRLSVRAPVSLKVSPRTAGVGRRIAFHGRLLAGPYPKGGKPVILEARAGKGAWIEFKVVHSGSRGRFRASYRFRFPGPVRYQFRALCEHEADYPYATGASAAIGVLER